MRNAECGVRIVLQSRVDRFPTFILCYCVLRIAYFLELADPLSQGTRVGVGVFVGMDVGVDVTVGVAVGVPANRTCWRINFSTSVKAQPRKWPIPAHLITPCASLRMMAPSPPASS